MLNMLYTSGYVVLIHMFQEFIALIVPNNVVKAFL